jgi:uncharacterized metal-binding protein YceD (DUF177 family)
MADPLRDRCSPRDLAAECQVIEISEKIGSFDLLAELVEADLSALDSGKIPANWRESMVTGTLKFSVADVQDAAVALEMSLATTLTAVCQRCLKAFDMPLSTQLRLMLSGPSDSLKEQDGYEIWEYSEEDVLPISIAEEALIMAMPLSARHQEFDDCVDVKTTESDNGMRTPFASLREQMDKDN